MRQRIWAWPRDAAGKNEKLSWGESLANEEGEGSGAGGKKESSADSAADEEGLPSLLACCLLSSSSLLLLSPGRSFGKCKFRESFMLPLEYLVLMDGFHFPHTSASHIGTSMCNMQQCDVHLGGSHCRPELRESLSSEPNFLSHSRQSIESPKS